MSHFLSNSFNDRPSLSVTVSRTSSVTSVDGNSPVTPTREERQRRRQERQEAIRREEEKLKKEYEQRREERKKQQESRITKIQQEAKENEERMKKLERERSIRSLTRGNSIYNSTTTSLSGSSSAISVTTSTSVIHPPTTTTSQPTTASGTTSTVPSYTYSQPSTTTAPLSMSESLGQNNGTRPDTINSRNSPKRTVARPLSAFLDNIEVSSSHSSVSQHQLNSSLVPKKSQDSLATSSVSLANASSTLANSGARDSLSSSNTDGKTSISQQNLALKAIGSISKPRSNSRLGEYRKRNLDVSFNGQKSEEEEEEDEDDGGDDTESSQSKVDTQIIPTKNEIVPSSTVSEKSTRMTNRLTSFMGARPTPINTRKPSGEALPRLSELSPASEALKSETTPLSSPHKVTVSPIINNAFEISDSPILPPHLVSMPSSPVNETTPTIMTTDLQPPHVKSVAVVNAIVAETVKQSVVPVGVAAVTSIPLTRSISVLVDSASPTSPSILNQTSTKTEKSKEKIHTSSKADPLASFNDWIETLSPSSAFTLTLMDNLPLSGSTQTVHSVGGDPSQPKSNGLIDIAKFLQAREIETVPTEEPKQTQVYLIRDKSRIEITAATEKGIFYSGENYIIVAQYPTQTVIWHWKGCEFQEGDSALINSSLSELEQSHKTTRRVIEQFKEPAMFLKSFRYPIVNRKGQRARFNKSERHIYQVLATPDLTTRVIETNSSGTVLCSGYSFIMPRKKSVKVWHGIGSFDVEKKAALKVATEVIANEIPIVQINEGCEDRRFWEKLKMSEKDRNYERSDVYCLKGIVQPNKWICYGIQFSFVNNSIRPTYFSLPNTPSVISPDNITLIDVYFEMYIILGSAVFPISSSTFIKLVLNSTLNFIDTLHDEKLGAGRVTRRKCFIVKQGNEPGVVKSAFGGMGWPEDEITSGGGGLFKAKSPATKKPKRTYQTVEDYLATMDTMTYPLEELKRKPNGLDVTRLEEYLSYDEFQAVFKIDRNTFNSYPESKRKELKKKVGLL